MAGITTLVSINLYRTQWLMKRTLQEHDEILFLAARVIVQRNVTERVSAVTVKWNPEESHLTLHYYVEGAVTDDESELCELATGELLAQFPDIETAENECVSMENARVDGANLDGLVYRK